MVTHAYAQGDGSSMTDQLNYILPRSDLLLLLLLLLLLSRVWHTGRWQQHHGAARAHPG